MFLYLKDISIERPNFIKKNKLCSKRTIADPVLIQVENLDFLLWTLGRHNPLSYRARCSTSKKLRMIVGHVIEHEIICCNSCLIPC